MSRLAPLQSLVPAAQYIRMSTDGQDLSPALQRSAIAEYAQRHGFDVIASYEDPGRSGLSLRGRQSMRRLIQDVAGDDCCFAAVLVYDVSRWGRFFDTDESAYYEYHCRLHGVQVHYVSEGFSPDLNLTTALLKNMKRVMAAEYSRELGTKCRAGQTRAVELGYQMGLLPCLGFRRMAVSADGKRQRILENGERKPAPTDRVRWVLGPDHEVELVRTIFGLYAGTDLSMRRIAEVLNRQGELTVRGLPFTEAGISVLLNCEAYIGNFLWGRKDHRTGVPRAEHDPAVSRKPAALPAIVDPQTWERVRYKRQQRSLPKPSDAQLLESLRQAMRRKPDLRECELPGLGCRSGGSYRRRFGSFLVAAELAVGRSMADVASIRQRSAATRTVLHQFTTDLLELLARSDVCARRLPAQSGILLAGTCRLRIQLLWRKDIEGRVRWQVKKRPCGDTHCVLFVRMQDSRSAHDFVLLTSNEYVNCPWSSELLPAAGQRCRTGEDLLQVLRETVLASPSCQVAPVLQARRFRRELSE